jgi:hypothetical protein
VSNVAQKCIALKITIIAMAGKPIPRNQKAKSGWMTVVRPSRRGKMRGFAVTLLALYLSVGAAVAQTVQEMTWALGWRRDASVFGLFHHRFGLPCGSSPSCYRYL